MIAPNAIALSYHTMFVPPVDFMLAGKPLRLKVPKRKLAKR